MRRPGPGGGKSPPRAQMPGAPLSSRSILIQRRLDLDLLDDSEGPRSLVTAPDSPALPAQLR